MYINYLWVNISVLRFALLTVLHDDLNFFFGERYHPAPSVPRDLSNTLTPFTTSQRHPTEFRLGTFGPRIYRTPSVNFTIRLKYLNTCLKPGSHLCIIRYFQLFQWPTVANTPVLPRSDRDWRGALRVSSAPALGLCGTCGIQCDPVRLPSCFSPLIHSTFDLSH